MAALVPIGTAITVLGLLGLVACIISVARARRAGLDEAALKARLQQIVAWNLAALGISALGLMTVILGIALS